MGGPKERQPAIDISLAGASIHIGPGAIAASPSKGRIGDYVGLLNIARRNDRPPAPSGEIRIELGLARPLMFGNYGSDDARVRFPVISPCGASVPPCRKLLRVRPSGGFKRARSQGRGEPGSVRPIRPRYNLHGCGWVAPLRGRCL